MLNVWRYEEAVEAAILAEPPMPDPYLAELDALELPGDDGEPMKNERERMQISLFLNALDQHWHDRNDFYAAGNMFIYYSVPQAQRVLKEINTDTLPQTAFRGPDIFVVLGVDGSYRRQKWTVWNEDGRYPNVIFELLSPTTRKRDLGEKKRLYEQTFHTREYVCFDYLDPESDNALQGWRLDAQGHYQSIEPDARGWLWSEQLNLWVGRWEGTFLRDDTVWMRVYMPDGELVLTDGEASRQRAERLEAQLRALGVEPEHA